MRWTPLFHAVVFAAITFTAPLPAAELPPLLLAEVDEGHADVRHYLVSEKLDGVRALWDGQVLRTRKGIMINAPEWFIAGFPSRPLDGELWMGRQSFERLSAAVRRQVPNDPEWREIRYMVFELPQALGTFRERAQAIETVTGEAGVPWLQAVAQFELPSRTALERRLAGVLKAGGEGLMLHRADAPYLTGRSDVLLKVKAWRDAEATVIGHLPGKGKHQGVLGALRVRTDAGVELRLGSGLSERDRRNPPAIGTVVTFRYRELTNRGVPRFASYYRVRD